MLYECCLYFSAIGNLYSILIRGVKHNNSTKYIMLHASYPHCEVCFCVSGKSGVVNLLPLPVVGAGTELKYQAELDLCQGAAGRVSV